MDALNVQGEFLPPPNVLRGAFNWSCDELTFPQVLIINMNMWGHETSVMPHFSLPVSFLDNSAWKWSVF